MFLYICGCGEDEVKGDRSKRVYSRELTAGRSLDTQNAESFPPFVCLVSRETSTSTSTKVRLLLVRFAPPPHTGQMRRGDFTLWLMPASGLEDMNADGKGALLCAALAMIQLMSCGIT